MTKENFRFSSREEYIRMLDMVLPDDYVQKREIKQGEYVHYYPTAIQEALADDIFHNWHVVKEDYIVIANELVCTVCLEYTPSYPGAIEHMCTGSAAIPIQMDRGAEVKDFPAKKKKNSLQYNLPAGRSLAIGCALQTIGNIFGRNLDRKLNQKIKISKDFKIRTHESIEPTVDKGNEPKPF